MRELAKVSPETLDYIQAELKRQGFGSSELKRSLRPVFIDRARAPNVRRIGEAPVSWSQS